MRIINSELKYCWTWLSPSEVLPALHSLPTGILAPTRHTASLCVFERFSAVEMLRSGWLNRLWRAVFALISFSPALRGLFVGVDTVCFVLAVAQFGMDRMFTPL